MKDPYYAACQILLVTSFYCSESYGQCINQALEACINAQMLASSTDLVRSRLFYSEACQKSF